MRVGEAVGVHIWRGAFQVAARMVRLVVVLRLLLCTLRLLLYTLHLLLCTLCFPQALLLCLQYLLLHQLLLLSIIAGLLTDICTVCVVKDWGDRGCWGCKPRGAPSSCCCCNITQGWGCKGR